MTFKRQIINLILLVFVVSNLPAFSQDIIDYAVQEGETLSSIAERYNMEVDALKSLNNFDDNAANRLNIGQKIQVIQKKQTTVVHKHEGNNDDKGQTESVSGNTLNVDVIQRKESTIKKSETEKVQNKLNFTLILGLLLLLVALVWQKTPKLRNKTRLTRDKQKFFIGVICIGALLILLLWDASRILIILIVCILGIGAIAYYLAKKTGRVNKQPSYNNYPSNNIDQLYSLIDQLKSKIDDLSLKNDELLRENIELGERIDKLKNPPPQVPIIESSTPLSPTCNNNETANVTVNNLYAEAILEGVLMKVKDRMGDDTIFELDLQSSNIASLTIPRCVHQRILANIAYIDGCEKQIMGNTTVEVIPGKAMCNDQRKWIVTEKPIVIIK